MKTEVYIFNLDGNRAAVRNYANTIASMSASNCNAYVMAFDKDNEILWTVQAGDDLDEVKTAINWQGVRRVEIYDHSADGTYKTEQVYITSRKSLNEYTAERSAFDFVIVNNNTQYTADNWQTEESDTQSNESNEDEQTAAEPSRLAQKAATTPTRSTLHPLHRLTASRRQKATATPTRSTLRPLHLLTASRRQKAATAPTRSTLHPSHPIILTKCKARQPPHPWPLYYRMCKKLSDPHIIETF